MKEKIYSFVQKALHKLLQIDKHNEKANGYLNMFKKPFSERTKQESILVECLYMLEFYNSDDSRFLGAAETVLVVDGYMENGKPYEYRVTPKKLCGVTVNVKESYREHIIRKAKEYLVSKNVL